MSPPHNIIFEMDKNEITWKSHRQAFAEEFSERGESGVWGRLLSGKYIAPDAPGM